MGRRVSKFLTGGSTGAGTTAGSVAGGASGIGGGTAAGGGLINFGGSGLTAGLSQGAPAAITSGGVSSGLGGGTAAGLGGAATAGAAGGAAALPILAWGFSEKGWLRGGEEGVKTNPQRDKYLDYFQKGFGGNRDEALANALAQSGVDGGTANQLMTQLYSAKTVKELNAAKEAINQTGAMGTLTQKLNLPTAEETYRRARGMG